MDDLISRQEAIDALNSEKVMMTAYKDGVGHGNPFQHYNQGLTDGIITLMKLPAAQPQREKGNWVCIDGINYECDQCGCVLEDWIQGAFYNYCPNCGADMRGNRND